MALLVAGRPAADLLPYQRKLDALGIPFDVLTQRDMRARRAGGLRGRRRARRRASAAAATLCRARTVVTTLAGIVPGLGP